MRATGCCYDNAVAESFFATLKKELACRITWHNIDKARADISAYINLFYNSRRRHSTLGYVSPSAFEVDYKRRHPAALVA